MYHAHYSYNGTCECFLSCSENMPNASGINCCKLKLGENYGKDIPKIMFVGKEGISPNPDISNPSKITEVHNNNFHYFGTIHTLSYILKKISGDEFLDRDRINGESLRRFDDLGANMCLTNYFKCAFRKEKSNNHDVTVNDRMKENCPAILAKEIEILKPDILIMQGKFSSAHFWGRRKGKLLDICDFDSELISLHRPGEGRISADRYVYKSTGAPLYIIWGYHPCAHGGLWYKSLEDFKKAIDKVCPYVNI